MNVSCLRNNIKPISKLWLNYITIGILHLEFSNLRNKVCNKQNLSIAGFSEHVPTLTCQLYTCNDGQWKMPHNNTSHEKA